MVPKYFAAANTDTHLCGENSMSLYDPKVEKDNRGLLLQKPDTFFQGIAKEYGWNLGGRFEERNADSAGVARCARRHHTTRFPDNR